MTTRNRSTPQSVIYHTPRVQVKYLNGTTSGWSNYEPDLYRVTDSKSMTDVFDNPKGLNPCSHTTRKIVGGCDTEISFTAYPSGYVSAELLTKPPVSVAVSNYMSHLGGLSGIKALAIARVPAYANAEVEGFIALAEAREIVDSTAVKAAAALAHFGITAYRSAKGGTLARTLGRDAKRALDYLRRGSKNPRALWGTVLDGLTTANSLDMEWKYGWKPMLETIQGANRAVETIAGLRQKLLDGVRVYGRATDVRVSSANGPFAGLASYGHPWWGNWTQELSKTTKTTATASIVRKLNPNSAMYDVNWFNSLDVVLEVNGLTPTLKSAWQLSSLTFITDWFWNVSQLLESLQSLERPVGTSFVSTGGMYSLKQETTVTGSITAAPPEGRGASYTSTAVGVLKTYSRDSDPLTGGPVLYIPPLKLPTKAGQWWSMAQIAFQQLAEKIR